MARDRVLVTGATGKIGGAVAGGESLVLAVVPNSGEPSTAPKSKSNRKS